MTKIESLFSNDNAINIIGNPLLNSQSVDFAATIMKQKGDTVPKNYQVLPISFTISKLMYGKMFIIKQWILQWL